MAARNTAKPARRLGKNASLADQLVLHATLADRIVVRFDHTLRSLRARCVALPKDATPSAKLRREVRAARATFRAVTPYLPDDDAAYFGGLLGQCERAVAHVVSRMADAATTLEQRALEVLYLAVSRARGTAASDRTLYMATQTELSKMIDERVADGADVASALAARVVAHSWRSNDDMARDLGSLRLDIAGEQTDTPVTLATL